MKQSEIDGLMLGVADVMQEYVGQIEASLASRIEAVEKREPIPGPRGKDGRDAELDLREFVETLCNGLAND
jgi:hypothetical protein